MRSVDQRHIEAGLAQQRQRAKDLEPVLLDVTEQAEHLLALPLQVGLIELLLFRMKVEFEDLLLFVGQIADDLVLGPAQHQRADPASELSQALAVALLLDRLSVVLGEPVRIGEEPGSRDRK